MKTSSLRLWSYDDIKLTLFITIAQTGNKQLLVINGTATNSELILQWESIIATNSEVNGDYSIQTYVDKLKGYGKLIADYELIRLHLFHLLLVVDDDSLKFLKSKRYLVNVHNGNEAMVSSIKELLHKSTSYLTYIKASYNDLLKQVDIRGSGKEVGVESQLAILSAGLGFNISEDITLARFNEYKKILKTKNKPKENAD